MELDHAIETRHSCRRFSTKKVNWEDIIECVDSANKAPQAGNIPVVRFVIVDNPEKIQKLADAAQQDFISNASYAVVVCSNPTQLKRSYDQRGEMYSRQQSGAAIENFLLKLTELGLATCWVGAFADEMVRHALSIPEEVLVEAILPVGYEMPPKSKQRQKADLDEVLYFNKWKEKRMKPLKMPEAR